MLDNNISNDPDYRHDFKSLFQNQSAIKSFIAQLQTQIENSEIDSDEVEKQISEFCNKNRSIRSIGVLAGKNIREQNFYTNLYTDSDEMKWYIRYLIQTLSEDDQIFHALQTVFSPYFRDRKFSAVQLSQELKKIFPELTDVDENEFGTTQDCYVIKSNKLTHLQLKSHALTPIPEKVFLCEHLIVLELANCSIDEIPKAIGQLKNIKKLNLDDNNLYQLPDEICQLEQLTDLSIINNRLEILPRNIGNLSKLQKLFLNENKIRTLPDSIQNLKILTELTLNNNQLETFPDEMGKLSSIVSIEAGHNQLKALPGSFYNLSTLKSLSLNANELSSVSDGMNQLKSLETLDLRNNQIDYLPGTFCELSHLKTLYLSKNRLSLLPKNINQLKSLEDLSLSHNQIEYLPASLTELTQLETLQIENNPLKNIPVDVILSGKDTIFEYLQQTDKQLAHEDIRYSIKERKQTSAYISFTEFKSICNIVGKEDDQVQELIETFHGEGIIFHFKEDPQLKSWVIIKPEWVYNEEKRILKNKSILQNKGYFNADDLKEIWKEYSSAQYSILLNVLRNLGIYFEKDSGYIAPQLLPESPPSNEKELINSATIQIEYHYQDMLRNMDIVVPRLIARMHDWCQHYWRYGMIVCYDNAQALIKRGESYRTIVRIKRDLRQDQTLWDRIQKEINIVHAQLKIPNVRAYVPCCCSICKSDHYKFYYYYHKLVEVRQKKNAWVYCGYSLEKVPVDNLI
jgi:Leucine-rich repeat (LRR) protein